MFRGGDEGIDDQILRATPPKTLLRITPTLFYIAMQMHSTSELTIDALDNGISYFVGPLLNWTLVGVMQTILRELMGKINMLKTHLHVVSSIILKDTCPRAILRMCGPGLLSMTSFLARSSSLPNQPPIYTHYRLADLQHKVVQASNGRLPAAKIIPSQKPLQPMEALHRALKRAGEGKAPVLDIERCLIATSPLAFLEVLWDALNHLEAHISSVSEGSRRIAVFVLASPPCPGTPPLLPIFLHSFVPPLLSRIDHVQVPAEHIILVELLSVILSSALTAAMHVEWAFQTVSKGAHPIVLGQSSSAMARSLAAELRRHKNSASRAAVLKRLCASQAFRTNFPMMVGD
ncbi:uncharacterized protein SCHCODRAFT_02663056 [Schizophyllum commune H4-8]|uniref:uncharacterized protein n=1 Tax=Schizophyllum commune (strain H4-8 / FGSC 9210) TaxID=578458 RepID=UPI00215FAB3C|nr:uncharacterized protein SCHCODRAFT_02663056 [Schizophyllum commune H4-8]KAI5898121.1 hypothetical protein SCHCODRAFT_02663056 [Schizophyllum commune H4-8]